MQKLSVKYLRIELNNPLKDYSPWPHLVQSQGAKFAIPQLTREMRHLSRPRGRKHMMASIDTAKVYDRVQYSFVL